MLLLNNSNNISHHDDISIFFLQFNGDGDTHVLTKSSFHLLLANFCNILLLKYQPKPVKISTTTNLCNLSLHSQQSRYNKTGSILSMDCKNIYEIF